MMKKRSASAAHTFPENSQLIRSRRKTLALQIAEDGHLIIRVPMKCPESEIASFIDKHRSWIEKHSEKVRQTYAMAQQLEPFSAQDIRSMAERAAEIIPQRVRFYAEKLGVTYGKITIRAQKTKWGSCTSKGNLSFNCLLMEAPPEVLDSIVVHELCHRIHMDHSKLFYSKVYSIFPDYDKCSSWLKSSGSILIKRLTLGKGQ